MNNIEKHYELSCEGLLPIELNYLRRRLIKNQWANIAKEITFLENTTEFSDVYLIYFIKSIFFEHQGEFEIEVNNVFSITTADLQKNSFKYSHIDELILHKSERAFSLKLKGVACRQRRIDDSSVSSIYNIAIAENKLIIDTVYSETEITELVNYIFQQINQLSAANCISLV